MSSTEQRQPSPPAAFAEPWLALWRYAATFTWGGFASLSRLYDPRPLRAAWSAHMTEALDRFFRSPEFLELMAAHLRMMASATRFASQLRPR